MRLSEAQFLDRIESLRESAERVQTVRTQLMVPDVHYGIIPGTQRPSLLKPGAELLMSAFECQASTVVTVTNGNGVTEPAMRAIAECTIVDSDGAIIAQGLGEANTHERKHRWRHQAKSCPSCGAAAIGRSKAEYGGGYYCAPKQGGCNAKFKPGSAGAQKIDAQTEGMVENSDPHDLSNTVLKMAKKRALVDGVIAALNCSGMFTQDMESDGASFRAEVLAWVEGLASAPDNLRAALIEARAAIGAETGEHPKLTAPWLLAHPIVAERLMAVTPTDDSIAGTPPIRPTEATGPADHQTEAFQTAAMDHEPLTDNLAGTAAEYETRYEGFDDAPF